MATKKTTGKKLADMMYGNPEGAAFGITPMVGKRREDRQDREAAKSFPVDLARGVVAGAAGMPGDIESLIRMLPGLNEQTVLPTSEDVLKRIPFGTDTPAGQFASGLGTLAGGSAPFGAIPRAVKAAPGALKAGARNLAAPRTLDPQAGAIVYHGTPHKFPPTKRNPLGEFNPEKIGTGEGNQAYGYGHYTAGEPTVAKEYRRKLGDVSVMLGDTPLDDLIAQGGDTATAAERLKRDFLNSSVAQHPDDVSNPMFWKQTEDFYKTAGMPETDRVKSLIEKFGPVSAETKGSLYEVDLPDEAISKMLDWDKPMSEQEMTRIYDAMQQSPLAGFAKAFQDNYYSRLENGNPPTDGQDLFMALSKELGGQKYVSDALKSAGIPGIRYLDEKSRGATGTGKWKIKLPEGEEKIYNFKPDDDALELMKATAEPYGTQNFVVFPGNEDLLNIVDRKAQGGAVHFSDNPDVMQLELAAGGLVKGIKAAAKAVKEPAQAPMKASEALGRIEGRPLVITQSDRTKVGGGFLGGPGFSSLQLTEPEYRAAEAVWGVKTPGVAKMILGGGKKAGPDPVYTTFIGTPNQHQSNQMVFDKLLGDFRRSARKGGLDPELQEKINYRLANAVDKEGRPIFPPDVNILDKNFRDLATTFDQRAVTSSLIGGLGVGGKKGQIVDYDKIIRNTTDPALLDVPTGALGNRLFTLSGGIIDRPDLHPAFPTILQGEDMGVSFDPVVRDLVMKDFIEKTMREKGRTPGYMDYTRGHPPSQLITEDILTEMQKLGLKAGGAVRKAAGGEVHGLSTADLLYMQSQEDLGKLPAHAQREAITNMGRQEVRQRMAGKYAGGGEITADDLILEERKL